MVQKDFLKLQLFAEGEADGAESNASGSEAQTASQENDTISFDNFLKGPGNQAEFDRRVQKAIQTAVSNAQRKWQTVTDDKVSEAEKLAQMTREEKAEYRARELEKALNDLKRQNAVSDMAKTARKMLADEEINLPDEVIFNLVSEDAELTKTAVEAFAKTFKEAVQAAVKDALRGTTPKAAGKPSEITKEQILNVKDTNERRRLMAENPELFIRR